MNDEGRKNDSDKVRLELVPPELVFAVGDILTFGAAKYDDRNWEKGMSWGRVFGALMRHLWAWWGGQGPTAKSFLFGDTDEETGRSHLWHAACCIAFLVAYEERGTGTDDRAKTPVPPKPVHPSTEIHRLREQQEAARNEHSRTLLSETRKD